MWMRAIALALVLGALAVGCSGSQDTDEGAAQATSTPTAPVPPCTPLDWDISPGAFSGGAPLPPQLYGSYGPGELQRWSQSEGAHDSQGSINEILGAPDGVQMIRWGEGSSLDGETTVECSTGWGCFGGQLDYGWENGIIFDLTPGTDVVFPHIWKLGTGDDGERVLEVWEVKITPDEDADEAITQLRAYIEEESDSIAWDVSYFSAPDMDGGVPTVAEEHWTCDAPS